MAQENQFGPKDISALSRIPKLFNLMEACLAGEVLEKFKKLTGNQRARPEYNASWGAYGLFYDVETWSLALGFFFGELEESPRTALEFYAKQSRSMPRFLLLQNDLLKQDGWEPYDWDGLDENSIGPESEPCVFHSKELNTFLDETNVPLIKQYFLNRMDEFESVKGIYRKLPW